jgi:hypothetical protein
LAAENWKGRLPKEVLALGMTIEIYLLERVIRVGVAMVTSELFDANAERHRMFLCWARVVKSGVNKGLYLFLVLHFLNGACLFKIVR